MTETKNPIDKVLPLITKAVAEWQFKNDEETIRTAIHKRLDKESDQITMKLLGFNVSYGRDWELDHCNGRSGNSAAGDFIRKAQQVAIEQWLRDIPLPVMSAALKKRLHKKMNDVYESSILDKVCVMAKAKADHDLTALLETLTPSNDLENYIKTIKLISPN
jgi:hypothetical protein